MNSRAATLDSGGPAAAEAMVADAVAAPARGGAMKFAYASGSRPLDGFVIKRGIGRGGFGEVYFATSDAGKELALKHIERNLEVELRGVGQCLNLKHPNLIDLYDIRYDDQGDAWVVMEYVAGASLKDTIDRVLPYYEAEIAPALRRGERIIVSAHGNSLRALEKHLSGIGDADIVGLEIPTGQPIVYELDDDLSMTDRYYLSER